MISEGFSGPNEVLRQFVVIKYISTQWYKSSEHISQHSLIGVNICSLIPVEQNQFKPENLDRCVYNRNQL